MSDTIDTVGQGQEFNWDGYEAPSEFVRPPEPGIYTFMRTDGDGDFLSGEFTTKDGRTAKWANFKAEIQGGKYNGRTAYGGCNTLKSDFRNGHTAADFLMSSRSALRPTTPEAFLTAIERTIGPFNAKTRWEWRCKDCEQTFLMGGPKRVKPPKKYGNMPSTYKYNKNRDGFNHVQTCPSCNQGVGANLCITDFVVPGTKAAVVSFAPAPSDLPPAAG